jgi:hypothetical protein
MLRSPVRYPVDPSDATGAFSRYDLLLTFSESEVALDAPPVSRRAPVGSAAR